MSDRTIPLSVSPQPKKLKKKKKQWNRKSGSRRPRQIGFTADVPYLQSLFLEEVIDINFKSLQINNSIYDILGQYSQYARKLFATKSSRELSWNKQCAEPVGFTYFLRINVI
jgi:hypothetical protein